MEPLAAARNLENLLKDIEDLQLGMSLRNFYIVHERIGHMPKHIGRVELRRLVSKALSNGRSSADESAQCPAEGEYSPCLVVLETQQWYIFGPVLFAPPSPKGDFKDAPHHWSAGIGVDLAVVAINIAASPGDTLLDPCCGTGTILYEAHRRGVRASGSDLYLGVLKLASENLQHFKVPHSISWGPTCPLAGPHNPKTLSSGRRPESLACMLAERADNLGQRKPKQFPASSSSVKEVRRPEIGGLKRGQNQYATDPEETGGLHLNLLVERAVSGARANCGTSGEYESASDRFIPKTRLMSSMPSGTAVDQGMMDGEGQKAGIVISSSGLSVGEEQGMIGLAIEDARKIRGGADCIVSNLPFGRYLKLDESNKDILHNLAGLADRYVFFGGYPLRRLLEEAGFSVIKEIMVSPREKRYMSIVRTLK